MKALFVTPYFSPRIGGLERYALNVAAGLQESHGWDVAVVTANHLQRRYERSAVDALTVHRLPSWATLSNTPVNPAWRWTLRRIIAEERPDLINAHLPVPFIADLAVRARSTVPVVVTYQNDLVKPGLVGRAAARAYYASMGRRTLRAADTIITSSMHYARSSPYLRPHLSKVRIVAPGFDPRVFRPAVGSLQTRQRLGGGHVIAFVGQLDRSHAHKGLDVLIRSLQLLRERLPSVALVIVGTGDHMLHYQQQAQRHGVASSIHFVGRVAEDDLPGYYSAADVVVLPSTTRAEGFGMVLLEASACGKPVIGSDIGGIPAVVQDGITGVLVTPRSDEALAAALHRVLVNPTWAGQLGQRGAERAVNEFTWGAAAQRTNDIFHEVLVHR